MESGGGGSKSWRSSKGVSTPCPGPPAYKIRVQSGPHTAAVQIATSATGDGSGHPTPVGGAQADPALRPYGPKWAVRGH